MFWNESIWFVFFSYYVNDNLLLIGIDDDNANKATVEMIWWPLEEPAWPAPTDLYPRKSLLDDKRPQTLCLRIGAMLGFETTEK